jgi:hypothetical protein
MSRLADLSLDELHTLCTALGNAVKAMEEQKARMQEHGRRETADYIECCIQDAELLQEEAVAALMRKNRQYKGLAPKTESKAGQTQTSVFNWPVTAAPQKLSRTHSAQGVSHRFGVRHLPQGRRSVPNSARGENREHRDRRPVSISVKS